MPCCLCLALEMARKSASLDKAGVEFEVVVERGVKVAVIVDIDDIDSIAGFDGRVSFVVTGLFNRSLRTVLLAVVGSQISNKGAVVKASAVVLVRIGMERSLELALVVAPV